MNITTISYFFLSAAILFANLSTQLAAAPAEWQDAKHMDFRLKNYRVKINPRGNIQVEKAGYVIIKKDYFDIRKKEDNNKWTAFYTPGEKSELKMLFEKKQSTIVIKFKEETNASVRFNKTITLDKNKIIINFSYHVPDIGNLCVGDSGFALGEGGNFIKGCNYEILTQQKEIKGVIPAKDNPRLKVVEKINRMSFDSKAGKVSFIFSDGKNWCFRDQRHVRWSRSYRFTEWKAGKNGFKREYNIIIDFSENQNKPVRTKEKAKIKNIKKVNEKSNNVALGYVPLVTYISIDLAGSSNMGFKDNEFSNDGKGGWSDQGRNGNDFRNFPTGKQTFCGVPFDIVNPENNNGKSCIVLNSTMRPKMPKMVAIPIEQKTVSIYFLHTFAFAGKGIIGKYIVVYDDNTEEHINIEAGVDISGWWKPTDTEKSIVAWQGKNPVMAPIGISLFGWNNPHQGKTISKIVFQSAKTGATPILAGITLSTQQYVLVKNINKTFKTNTSAWVPWVINTRDAEENATSVRYLNDAPSGKYGFLTVKDGHFYFKNNKRARFFGATMGVLTKETKESIEKEIKHVAKLGFNLIRLDAIDRSNLTVTGRPPGRGIFNETYIGKDTQHYSQEYFDKLDYFIYQSKLNGIYIYSTMLFARRFTEKDGVVVGYRDKFGHSLEQRGVYFDEKTIELQKKYIKDVFTHYNPYTKLRYCDDPTIAFYQIANEHTLFMYKGGKKAGVFCLTGSYKEQMQSLWNAWLLDKYKTRGGIEVAWRGKLNETENPEKGTVELQFPVGMTLGGWGGKSSSRLDDATLFIYELQNNYYNEIYSYLRSIGVQAPISGSNDLHLTFPDTASQASLDFVDCHPYYIQTSPMLKADYWTYDTITQMVCSKIAGKPLGCLEWNYHNKNIFDFRCDAPLFVTAYSSFQDLDILVLHGYGFCTQREQILWNQHTKNDPAIMGQWQAAANLFLRRDVKSARKIVDMGRYYKDTFYKRNMYRPIGSFIPYIHGVQTVLDLDEMSTPALLKANTEYFKENLKVKPQKELVSDTGELFWNHDEGIFRIDTERTQAGVGFFYDKPLICKNVTIQSSMKTAVSISITSLDGAPISSSKRMLLTAAGRSENTGMVWDAMRLNRKKNGKGPVLMEPVEATITLHNLRSIDAIKVYALDVIGKRKKLLPIKHSRKTLTFDIGTPYKTMYYEVVRN